MKRILPLGLAVLLLGGVGVHNYRNQVETNEALAKGELLSINQLKARQIETLSEERLLVAALAGMLVLLGLLDYALHTRQRFSGRGYPDHHGVGGSAGHLLHLERYQRATGLVAAGSSQ